jgi:hypothetical protein
MHYGGETTITGRFRWPTRDVSAGGGCAADTQLCMLNLARTKRFARTADGVIFGISEGVNIVHAGPDFGREELAVKSRSLGLRSTIQSGPIGESEGLGGFLLFMRTCR